MPDKESALQFAIMIHAGLPATHAISYFFPDIPLAGLQAQAEKWLRSVEVQRSLNQLQGKSWTAMTLQEKINYAIDKHYSELAYFLYSHNYSDLSTADKQKADTARVALEQKLAGLAGKMDPLTQFYADVQSGKVKLVSLAQTQPLTKTN